MYKKLKYTQISNNNFNDSSYYHIDSSFSF